MRNVQRLQSRISSFMPKALERFGIELLLGLILTIGWLTLSVYYFFSTYGPDVLEKAVRTQQFERPTGWMGKAAVVLDVLGHGLESLSRHLVLELAVHRAQLLVE